MLPRAFLIITGLIFTLYGAYCLLNPMIINEYTGMGLADNTALIEVRAMYGGLQLTAGLYLLFCSMQANRFREALLVSVFVFAGLAGARAFGLAIDGGDNGYNFGAVIYESISGLLALVCLKLANKQSSSA